ncbi:hypothetical protein [Streptomyces sp. NPDC001978]|uniref:hypothetical protein n=1 Tax=Streptomyces sp. NPDC001978 TaxID=3364627 RepID=UPI0036BD3A89
MLSATHPTTALLSRAGTLLPTPPDTAGAARRAKRDRLLDLAVRDTGAHARALFLLASRGQAPRHEVATGMPANYLAPWLVGLASHILVAKAVRERRLV